MTRNPMHLGWTGQSHHGVLADGPANTAGDATNVAIDTYFDRGLNEHICIRCSREFTLRMTANGTLSMTFIVTRPRYRLA